VSTETPTPAQGESLAAAVASGPGRRRKRRVLAPVVLLVVAAAVVLIVTDPFSGPGGSSGGAVTDNEYPTSTQTVARESIVQQTQVSATLGYAGDLTIRAPVGNPPAAVTQAQQTVTTDQGMLASAQSTLSSDAASLSEARATLGADQQLESVDCAGNNAAPTTSGGTASGASGGCATDVQLVATGQQTVAADDAKVSTDQSQVSSAEHSLAAAQTTLTSTDAQATVYGQDSTFTSVPSAGEIVRRGQPLYAIDGQPVLLMYGATVATRAFASGMSAGPDVAELNANLDALGYAHALSGDAFTAATAAAIGRLQVAHGESQTDELLLGSVTFESGPIRVTSLMPTVAAGSGVVAGPVLSASWITRQVSIQLDAGLEGQVHVGDPVTITLPDNQTTPGRISYVSSVASSGQNGPTIAVDAVPTDPAATGDLDQAPVNVAITTASASNVLVVPVDALLALARGGYAVEEIADGTHVLVAVTTGLFDDADGTVQVSGNGLAVGQRVVVPGE
jgi:hypothetical protein